MHFWNYECVGACLTGRFGYQCSARGCHGDVSACMCVCVECLVKIVF